MADSSTPAPTCGSIWPARSSCSTRRTRQIRCSSSGCSWAAPGPSSHRAGRSRIDSRRSSSGRVRRRIRRQPATGRRVARGAAAGSRIVPNSTPLAYAMYGHPATLLKRRPGPSRGTSPGTDRAAGRSSGMRNRSRRLPGRLTARGSTPRARTERSGRGTLGRHDSPTSTSRPSPSTSCRREPPAGSRPSAREVIGGSGRQRVLIPGSSASSALAPSKTSRGRLTRSGPRLPSSSGTLRSPTVTRASKRLRSLARPPSSPGPRNDFSPSGRRRARRTSSRPTATKSFGRIAKTGTGSRRWRCRPMACVWRRSPARCSACGTS